MEGYVLAAFRSRTQTMAFYDRLKRVGCMAVVVNTPKEAHVGCGVSVRFYKPCIPIAERELYRGKFSAFAGFFEVCSYGGTIVVKTLKK
ncbi:MAG: DUF3343 domain-containing protein [Clostridia bacterium]|jgi:hypothetical protein|nr:DUF3343 domain-containing protein [Clostridia bacterium]MBQ1943291.1 DUF3343 domain-containing protein [Clostridia bacterium]